MKKPKESLYVELGFENFMSRIYGQGGHQSIAGRGSLKDFIKHVDRVVRTLQTKIRRSVIGDDAHREVLLDRCDSFLSGLRRYSTKDQLICGLSQWSLTIAFDLLGGMPDNGLKGRTNHQVVTAPPPYRTLNYVRTDEQRAKQILGSAIRGKLGSEAPKFEDLIDVYRKDCARDYQRFMALFRRDYPQIYTKFNP